MKLFKFLFLISFLFSCQSENNKDYPSQEKEIKTDSNSIENISKIDSNEDSSESFNENSMEIDSNYAALFNDNEWLALKSDENLINNSARCSKCWHDHDYSPFKVKDTIQTIFFDKKTKDTSATLITISSARLSNISDVLNNKSETIFNKEIKVYKKELLLENGCKSEFQLMKLLNILANLILIIIELCITKKQTITYGLLIFYLKTIK